MNLLDQYSESVRLERVSHSCATASQTGCSIGRELSGKKSGRLWSGCTGSESTVEKALSRRRMLDRIRSMDISCHGSKICALGWRNRRGAPGTQMIRNRVSFVRTRSNFTHSWADCLAETVRLVGRRRSFPKAVWIKQRFEQSLLYLASM